MVGVEKLNFENRSRGCGIVCHTPYGSLEQSSNDGATNGAYLVQTAAHCSFMDMDTAVLYICTCCIIYFVRVKVHIFILCKIPFLMRSHTRYICYNNPAIAAAADGGAA